LEEDFKLGDIFFTSKSIERL